MHHIQPYSDILASAETPAPQHKDWVTLSAGSGYRLFFFIPSLHSFDRHKASSHKNTHTHYRLLFCESKCDALPGLSNVASIALFSPLQQSAIRAASCQPSFWYLYFHRILITLFVSPFFHACFSPPVSRCTFTLKSTFSCCDFKVLTFCIVLCTRLFLSH